jgi:hypothetical protein
MEIADSIISKQKHFVDNCKNEAKMFIDSIRKDHIETVLLSGSVARGDYYPGRLGGMIDLTVFAEPNSNISAEDVFGKNEDPNIPFHCIRKNGTWFQIDFGSSINCEIFQKLDESRKYALLESNILYDLNGKYNNELIEIRKYSRLEQRDKLSNGIHYVGYLLSDYKKDRWIMRDANIQLHENLNTAIKISICCLYYKNGKYAPAEDRRLYYSMDLDYLPENYVKALNEIYRQDFSSHDDYCRREKIFYDEIFPFINE